MSGVRDDTPPTVARAVQLWLDWVAAHRKPATLRHYRQRLRLLIRHFGHLELSRLEPLEVETWLTAANHSADGKPLAPDTRRANAVVFLAWQQWCLDHRLLERAMVNRLDKPAGRKRERIPTPDETRRLVEAMTPPARLFYLALRYSGARPSELAAANLEQWDRAGREIYLETHKTERTGDPRVIAVGTKLHELLELGAAERTTGPIFLTATGKRWTPDNFARAFRQARRQAKLPEELIPYLARHEHGTAVGRAKGIKAAADSLGHKSLRTTARYVKRNLDDVRDNQDLL